MLTLEVAHVIVAIVVVVVLIVAAALISWKSAINYHIKVGEAKVGSAEEKAREIIDDALKTAETKKRCLLYTSPSPRDIERSRMPSSA